MMKFEILFTEEAEKQLLALENNKSKKAVYKAVVETLALMTFDLRHPSLNTHEFSSLSKKYGYKVFESYAQNHTPGAYRIFWRYGLQKSEVLVLAITPHP